MNKHGMREFRVMWLAMSFCSMCDAFGGAEYKRVRELWRSAPVGTNVIDFIRRFANQGATDQQLPEPGTNGGVSPRGE
jgi:hypothetical protein